MLISDNELQFNSKAFREYCGNLRIISRYSSYPQSNEQVKAINKTIVNDLKKRLEEAKGNWVKKLLNVLWAYQTTPRRSTGETPFSMTYEAETVILIEVGLSSIKVADFARSNNDVQMVGNLGSLEERQDMVSIHLMDYQQKLAQGYNRKVRPREFVAGNLVLGKAIGSMKDQNVGKLAPNWEGPN